MNAPQNAPYSWRGALLMASIQKVARGYRAQIKMQGVRDSALFPTRREAVLWAAQRETIIKEHAGKPAGELCSLRDALRRYAREVSPKKRGALWERLRLNAFESYRLPLDTPIAKVTAQHIADFRDARGVTVSDGTVLRELTLLSSVFEMARREWCWVVLNPCRAIRKPAQPKHRERVLAWGEVRAMLRAMGYRRCVPVRSVGQSVAACMLLAMRTGMRAGELCGLGWQDVKAQHVHLPLTKNGKSRDVPLSSKALRVLAQLRGFDDKSVFGLKTASLDALFRKYRARAGLSGFTFHDTRHTAATMLCKKVDVLTLCKIFGWSNTSQALTYYNPQAASIAALLG